MHNTTGKSNRGIGRLSMAMATIAISLTIAGSSLTAQAQSIQGSLDFIGGATLNGPLGSATAFSSIFAQVLPGSENGSYSGVPDSTPATFTSFAFDGSQTLPFTLFTFNVGLTNYSFQVTSIHIDHQDSTFLDIMGSGIASITGFNDTTGTWTITDTGLSGSPVFTFGAGVNVVPEPTTLACLALGTGIFAGFRRLTRKSR